MIHPSNRQARRALKDAKKTKPKEDRSSAGNGKRLVKEKLKEIEAEAAISALARDLPE